jgi:putative acetyltransferase
MNSLAIRPAVPDDFADLVSWLQQPGVLRWFPLSDLREVEDAARIWLSSAPKGGALTALWEGVPCGSATLYLQPYQKLAHQCLFAIIVDEQRRGQGVGRALLTELMRRAKEELNIELLHLEVYEGNPAIHLYERLGFVRYGIERHFVKEGGTYLSKIMMQQRLSNPKNLSQ